jgi:hypothetical protein
MVPARTPMRTPTPEAGIGSPNRVRSTRAVPGADWRRAGVAGYRALIAAGWSSSVSSPGS